MSNKRSGEGRPTAGRNPSGGGAAPSDPGVTSWNDAVGDVHLQTDPFQNDQLRLTQLDATHFQLEQFISASWDSRFCRVYAVDGVNGNDDNRGYADPTSTGTAAYAVACAAAGLVAKQTFAGLAKIFPRNGAGRFVEIVILGGGTVYTGSIGEVLQGVGGYLNNCPFVRGTFTNATAGSVAFAGTTADVTYAGAQTVTGMNAAGYNPVAGPTTTSSVLLQKVGGAVPSFATEPAVPLGWRVRFDAATATVALRNVCRQICQVSGTNTIGLQTALPAVPGATDVCYLEMAGWSQGALTLQGVTQVGTIGAGISLVSMLLTGALTTGSGNSFQIALSGCASWSHSGISTFTSQQAITHPVLGSLTFGGGMRSEAGVSITGGRPSMSGLVSVLDTTFTTMMSTFAWGAGCVARQLTVINGILPQVDSNQTGAHVGTISSIVIGQPRTIGIGANTCGFYIDGSQFTIGNMICTNAATGPAVKLAGRNSLVVKGVIGGTFGNVYVGMDLQSAVLSTVELRSSLLPTVAGTLGELRMAKQALAVWTNLNYEEIWDNGGNHIFVGNINAAAYNAALSPSVYAGFINNAAPMAPYTVGAIQTSSGQVKYAIADTILHAVGVVGVLLTGSTNGSPILYGGMSGYKVVQFDGIAPVVPGAVAYLSDAVAAPGTATCTVPAVSATKAKLRLGVVVDSGLPAGLAIVRMSPDIYPILADGLP